MAFKNGLSERLDELRFPSPRSPPSESAFPGYTSLSPGHSNLAPGFSRPTSDVRANLQRRFTTDSSKFSSSWNYLNQGSTPMPDPLDLLSSFEKKRQHIEYMREQKRRFEEDMKLLDMQHEKEKIEMDQLARDLAKAGLGGPASEPTTPPEYRDSPVQAAVSRPGRFSSASVTSSPGFFNVFAPSSQLTSPQQPVDRFAGHSVPGSRRNSEKEEFVLESNYRPSNAVHRLSLPSSNFNSQYRPSTSGFGSSSGVNSFAGTKHLFPSDEDKPLMRDEDRLSTPDIKGYIRMTEPDDKFPTLSRRGGSNILSANPDALDLAGSRTPGPESNTSFHSRHRSAHQSMPKNLTNFRLDQLHNGSSTNDEQPNGPQPRHAARHSLGEGFVFPNERSNDVTTPVPSNRPVPLQSYSTNDLPTVKGSSNGTVTAWVGSPPAILTPTLARHHLRLRAPKLTFNRVHLHFGPQIPPAASNNGVSGFLPPNALQFPISGAMSGGYPPQPFVNQGGQVANPYLAYPNFAGGYRFNDPNTRGGVGQRRQTESDSSQLTRFTNFPLEHYKGELYSLCKDQHGCRYLQRKLEERNPEHVQLIFSETYMHVIELMTDPFGNYLCQKLLEFSNDEQRTALIDNAAPQLVKIALNQHGTRALQKMIEFISYSRTDYLNGNHVIQKCLNRLSKKDAEFIYQSVGDHCVTVGTHRHGCCVLQRCIDHASGEQKDRLIGQITKNAYQLVQDPFGNYVVQYILDLGDPFYTGPLCVTFAGNVPVLSKQKFSSNVIEKCLRTADTDNRRAMIDEILSGNELEKMLRDSYANYVVQTAMEFADPETRARIIEAVRPLVHAIRGTPHGRRIAGKIMSAESSGRTSGHVTPNETGNTTQIPKQAMQKPFGFQQGPGPTLNGSNAFNSQNALPTPAQSSSNTPPSGATEGPMFTSPGAGQNIGVQNQLYAYY
ncbi:Armadillo-like helical [Penicillium hetheringtonii]|uniref:Armadillo-like helical n=1 Tax=Penicillium hetheringtonii TaxID=911720 RepID=A0AAD6DR54_9EURO|nr:Armadillo-like helical [Penicillium hetheringtonii]